MHLWATRKLADEIVVGAVSASEKECLFRFRRGLRRRDWLRRGLRLSPQFLALCLRGGCCWSCDFCRGAKSHSIVWARHRWRVLRNGLSSLGAASGKDYACVVGRNLGWLLAIFDTCTESSRTRIG